MGYGPVNFVTSAQQQIILQLLSSSLIRSETTTLATGAVPL